MVEGRVMNHNQQKMNQGSPCSPSSNNWVIDQLLQPQTNTGMANPDSCPIKKYSLEQFMVVKKWSLEHFTVDEK